MFDWFKKERPLGLTGSGGGLGYLSGGGGGFEASGGNVRDAYNAGNGYIYHTFTSPGNTATSSADIDVMIVAGGAGAAGGYSAGSGGGGVVRHTQFACTAGTYPIVVGDGGSSAETNSAVPAGTQGEDSTAFGMTAKGGGAGGNYPTNSSGVPGGSGGGEQDSPFGAGNTIQPSQNGPFVPQTGFNQYGYKGGEGATVGAYTAAGGGGAGPKVEHLLVLVLVVLVVLVLQCLVWNIHM